MEKDQEREKKLTRDSSSDTANYVCIVHTLHLLKFLDEEEEARGGEQKGAPFNHTYTGLPSIRLLSWKSCFLKLKKGQWFFGDITTLISYVEPFVRIIWSGEVRITLYADKKKGIWILKIKDRMFSPRSWHTYDNIRGRFHGYPYHPNIWIKYLVRTQCISAWCRGSAIYLRSRHIHRLSVFWGRGTVCASNFHRVMTSEDVFRLKASIFYRIKTHRTTQRDTEQKVAEQLRVLACSLRAGMEFTFRPRVMNLWKVRFEDLCRLLW